jgi:hypothetical protein
MRPIKRLLLFAGEVGIIGLGLILSSALAIWLGFIAGQAVGAFAFYFGLLLTLIAFFITRRRHRPLKIEYDAVGWQLSQVDRKLHPVRVRYKRIALRVLLCVPSAIAAMVMFFFPVASHLVHLRSHYLRHYRIPIPWTFAVFKMIGPPSEYEYVIALSKRPFGVTPFWGKDQVYSGMSFGVRVPDPGRRDFDRETVELMRHGADQMLSKEFRLADIEITCRQYVPPYRGFRAWPLGTERSWQADCEAPVDRYRHSFNASFYGRQEDLPAFYKVIEGVTPV